MKLILELRCDAWNGNQDWDCCTVDRPCGVGEGDCDDHVNGTDCQAGLICGVQNCHLYMDAAPLEADCCEKPGIN